MGPRPPAACESVNLLREPEAANPHVRFDEREVETEQGKDKKAPATEKVGHRYASPKPPRHFSTLPDADDAETQG